MRTVRPFLAISLILAASPLLAAMQSKREFKQQWALAPGGAIEVNNAFGNVDIVGSDDADVAATVTKTIVGLDEKALEEGHERTELRVGGDDRMRVITTINPLGRNPRWSGSVDYQLRVPRGVHVRVKASTSGRIRVANVRGNVTVTTFSGLVILDNVGGASTVENTNGSILMVSDRPIANADLTSINGDVTLVVAPTANFQWTAESLKGDIRSTIPVRGELMGTAFRGNVNAPGGPQIRTRTMMGAAVLVHRGAQPPEAVALRSLPQSSIRMVSEAPRPVPAQRQQLVQGRYEWKTAIGDLDINEVRGDAFIETGAGEVRLGNVFGIASVRSGGGPLHLGEIHGQVIAITRAGDITVDAARVGGNINTAGGLVRVFYTGGPTALSSGGGDIVVHQAVSSINATTRSGDINITMDWSAKTENVIAKTSKGNITLNVNPRFAATIDATVVTTDAEANTIKSELPGLSIQKEQIAGGKTRVRATGRINGGGERVELWAEEGGIRIISQAPAPLPKR
jgi:DUF4097 and DUF4098 domain-containing protein YvlB